MNVEKYNQNIHKYQQEQNQQGNGFGKWSRCFVQEGWLIQELKVEDLAWGQPYVQQNQLQRHEKPNAENKRGVRKQKGGKYWRGFSYHCISTVLKRRNKRMNQKLITRFRTYLRSSCTHIATLLSTGCCTLLKRACGARTLRWLGVILHCGKIKPENEAMIVKWLWEWDILKKLNEWWYIVRDENM